MKEFKFTGTLRPERIQPCANYRESYQKFRADLVTSGWPYPAVEVIIRVRDPRQDWIDTWYTVAKEDDDIFIKFCKDVTFICAKDTKYPQEIACAAPRRGDKYDKRTGIAVAYAKLCSENIPDYI